MGEFARRQYKLSPAIDQSVCITRYKWNLSWMVAECFDSFLCCAETSADMARAKKWLKSQILQPWQLDLIKLYRFNERPTRRMFIELMRERKAAI